VPPTKQEGVVNVFYLYRGTLDKWKSFNAMDKKPNTSLPAVPTARLQTSTLKKISSAVILHTHTQEALK
jgi:hypothetical protein